jgi:4-hydroxy-3-methylbut-2-enyl diphosphate reductase
VETLKAKGAIFVEELDEIPETGAPVIFSAHGVPQAVPDDAEARGLFYLDATCPLVSKVHAEARAHQAEGLEIVLIGHAGHPEVIGTMGQLPDGAVTLVEDEGGVAAVMPADPEKLGFVTQTTLSVEDTAGVIRRLQERFPAIQAPAAESICYATTNRQDAVKESAPGTDLFLVVGAPNSSNSRRLVEMAERSGARRGLLVQRAAEIPWSELGEMRTIGLSAGASAPEIIVEEILSAFRERYEVRLDLVVTAEETENFPVMRALRDTPLTRADMAFVNG